MALNELSGSGARRRDVTRAVVVVAQRTRVSIVGVPVLPSQRILVVAAVGGDESVAFVDAANEREETRHRLVRVGLARLEHRVESCGEFVFRQQIGGDQVERVELSERDVHRVRGQVAQASQQLKMSRQKSTVVRRRVLEQIRNETTREILSTFVRCQRTRADL